MNCPCIFFIKNNVRFRFEVRTGSARASIKNKVIGLTVNEFTWEPPQPLTWPDNGAPFFLVWTKRASF